MDPAVPSCIRRRGEEPVIRRLSSLERELYQTATGRRPPPCLIQRWRWWLRHFRGFALAWLILVRDDDDPAAVCHEVEHVAQWWARPVSFWPRYLYELVRVGYASSRYERAARQVGDRVGALAHTSVEPSRRQQTSAHKRGLMVMHCLRESIRLNVSVDVACDRWIEQEEFFRILASLRTRAGTPHRRDPSEWDWETIERARARIVLSRSDGRPEHTSSAEFAAVSDQESRITVMVPVEADRPALKRQLIAELARFKALVEQRARRK